MSNNEGAELVRDGGSYLIWAGVFGVIIGIGLALPLFTGIAVVMVAAILLGVASVLQIMSGAKMEKGTKGRGWTITGGILGVLCAGAMLSRPVFTLSIITYVIAVFLIIDGVLRIAGAFELKPRAGWGWLLFGGIVSGLLGFMLIAKWPYSGLWFIGTVIGIHVLFGAFSRIMLGMAAKNVAKEMDGGAE